MRSGRKLWYEVSPMITVVAFLTIGQSVPAQLPPANFYQLRRDIDLFSSSYYTIAEDPYGFIWFGSHDGGGLYRYDGYELKTFIAEPGKLNESIAGSRIITVYFSPDSLIYIGTTMGFTRMDPVTGELKNYNNIVDSLPETRIGSTSSFLHDTVHHVLWIGTMHGLAKMDPLATGKFEMLRPETAIDNKHMPEKITRIIQDNKNAGLLWLGSYNGLFSYDIRNDQYEYVECPQLSGSEFAIYDLYQDTVENLWLSTDLGFVMGYNKMSSTWKVYSIPDASLTRKNVYGLLPVNENEFWISAHGTVGRLNLTSGSYEAWQYSPENPGGLLHNGVYRDLLNDRHGRLWVSSWHGIQYARHAYLPKPEMTMPVKVAITEVNAIPVIREKKHPLLYNKELKLERDQRDVTFHFVLPNPLDPGRVTYQYKLKGYDKDWITTDQRIVRYPRLGGGEYSFVVRAREGDVQEWSPETHLVVTIDKRISEMIWFWAGIILVIALIAVMIYRWLITRARKEERMKSEFEHKLSEIQMQALRAQMNPHFLFNSLNSIKYFAITKDKDETANYLSKFALLVRMILNNSKSHTISLKDEIEALRLYIEIEHLRLDGSFDYKLDIDDNIHVRQAQIPPMILQPFVENAIWHGLMHKEGRGLLLVQVKDMGTSIQCIIEDNGIGRKQSAEIRAAKKDHKTSVGMQITGDRIALINSIYHIDTQVHVIDLENEKGEAAGTRVVINIPLIQEEEE